MECSPISIDGKPGNPVQNRTAPEGAVPESVAMTEDVAGFSNAPFLPVRVGRNVNHDVHADGNRYSGGFCRGNGGGACLRLW